MQERSFSNSLYRYAFNGKEMDSDFGNQQIVQDYGFRIYNPSIARFLSVDPLSSSYPWNSTYAFAENRVIDGIDLEGGEYLRADESRIEIIRGIPMLKVENLNRFTRGKIAMINSFGPWKPGFIGFDRRITDLQSIPQTQEVPQATVDPSPGAPDPNFFPDLLRVKPVVEAPLGPFRKDGRTPDMRYNVNKLRAVDIQTNNAFTPIGRNTGIVGLALNAVNLGLDQYAKHLNGQDNELLNEHLFLLGLAADALIVNIDLVPLEYRNEQDMGNILNFMLQGVNNTNDVNIESIASDILKKVGKFRYPTKTVVPDFGLELSPADNTRGEPLDVPIINNDPNENK